VGHIVHSGASRPQNIDALIFMLGCARCSVHKKHVGTRYTELVFLHPVRFVGCWWSLSQTEYSVSVRMPIVAALT
jgi:hypothetical protein